MAAVLFDTSEFIEDLEKEGIEHKQARAFVNVVLRSQEIVLREVSVRAVAEMDSKTEKALLTFRHEVDSRLVGLENHVNSRFAEMETKVDKRFAEMEAKVDKRFAEMEAKVDKRFVEIKGEMSNLELGLRKDMEALGNKLIIRLTLAMLGVFGIAGTIAGFVLRAMLK